VPPPEVRDLRALVAQRFKMVRLSSPWPTRQGRQAKNRLQSLLHRHRIAAPEDLGLYAAETRPWREELPIWAIERVPMQCDLDTLAFAAEQRLRLESCIAELAAADPRVPLLIQLPGIGLIVAVTILAPVGDITRFPAAEKLVGYGASAPGYTTAVRAGPAGGADHQGRAAGSPQRHDRGGALGGEDTPALEGRAAAPGASAGP